MHGACGVRRGHVGIPTHSRDSAGAIDKNGAILEGRRRDRVHATGSDAEHRKALSAIGYRLSAAAISGSPDSR
jgi:hypothetical protein